jgi:hypothetical protein
MSEQPARYDRSFSGMIGAMLVLLLVVGAFVAFRDLNRNDPADPVTAIAYSTSARFARRAATFDLQAPRRLPSGWIATSVRFTDGQDQSWHLGCLTDQRRYVGLEQADAPLTSMLQEFVGDGAVRGADVQVAGRTWETWTTPDQDLALVRPTDQVTTVVVGRVPPSTLETFIRTLH